MYVGTINQTSVADTNIPITTELSTNRKVVYNASANTLNIQKIGLYKVDGYLQLSGYEGNVNVNILHNGIIARQETVTLASATTTVIVPLFDVFKCVVADFTNIGNVSIQVGTSGVTINGIVSVEYIQ